MGNLIKKASAGNKKAVVILFERYIDGAKAICGSCLENNIWSSETTLHAFRNALDELFVLNIRCEEEFQKVLYKHAAILCRKRYARKGTKKLTVPQKRNFTIIKIEKEFELENGIVENLLAAMPPNNRFIFVLHRIAEFDEMLISTITGYKRDMVEDALRAEECNLARILDAMNQGMGLDINLQDEISAYRNAAELPEEYREKMLNQIELILSPFRKRKIKRCIWCTVCGVGIVILTYAIFAWLL